MYSRPSLILTAAFLSMMAVASCGQKDKSAPRVPAVIESTAATTRTESTPPAPAPQEPPARRDSARVKPDESVKSNLPADVLRTYPSAARIDSVVQPFAHVVVRSNTGSILGYIADTDAAGTTARGFGGPVPLRIYFDFQARPKRIYILDNVETPAYVEIVTNGGLLDRLLLYDPAQPDSIAAVTLATCSSRAIIQGVTATAGRVAGELARPQR
jgi:hypothetical protein